MKLIDIGSSVEIKLSNSLHWTDEMQWSPVVSNVQYSLTGALLIESAVKQSGRPISLAPPDNDMGWAPRSTVMLLRDWAATADRRMTLVLEYPNDTRQFTVRFRHQEGSVIEAKPVKGFPEHNPDDWFSLSLKLIEVI